MTQPDVQLEHDELIKRADELEVPQPAPPATHPNPPCNLEMITKAAQTLATSVDNMAVYLKVAEEQRKALATSLRNAAKAYETTDENVAESVSNGGQISAAMPVPVGVEGNSAAAKAAPLTATNGYSSAPTSTQNVGATSAIPDAPDDYVDLEDKTIQIEQIDGTTHSGVPVESQIKEFTDFADSWTKYKKVLMDTADPSTGLYRPFQYWTGDSASKVEANMRQTRSWVIDVAGKCDTLADQAKNIVSAHKVNRNEHPTYHQVKTLDDEYENSKSARPHYKTSDVVAQYDEYQKESDDALKKYTQNGGLPIAQVTPGEPPSAYVIAAPDPTPTPGPTPDPTDDGTYPFLPSSGGTPFTPQQQPPDMSGVEDALAGLQPSGVKPASVGGGGGMPSMPLQPAMESEASARPASTPGTGLGRGLPGGAMGGPGMGMAPMGGAPGGSGQDNQTKRGQQEEEALYTEERSWTEGVIGSRRRKDVADSKESK